jgi:hypothetical protein
MSNMTRHPGEDVDKFGVILPHVLKMGINIFAVIHTDVAISITHLAIETKLETLVGKRMSPLSFSLVLDYCLVMPSLIHSHQFANNDGARCCSRIIREQAF